MDCFVNSGHRRLLSRVASNGHGPWQRHMRRALSSLCVGFSAGGDLPGVRDPPRAQLCACGPCGRPPLRQPGQPAAGARSRAEHSSRPAGRPFRFRVSARDLPGRIESGVGRKRPPKPALLRDRGAHSRSPYAHTNVLSTHGVLPGRHGVDRSVQGEET